MDTRAKSKIVGEISEVSRQKTQLKERYDNQEISLGDYTVEFQRLDMLSTQLAAKLSRVATEIDQGSASGQQPVIAPPKVRLENVDENDEDVESLSSYKSEAIPSDALTLIAQMLQKLTEAELSKPKFGVANICKNNLVPFQRDDIRNFLKSVEHAVKEAGPSKEAAVVQFAKTRVKGDLTISTTDYESFSRFESDVIRQFKPSEDHSTLETKLAMLVQEKDEKIEAYCKRAKDLRVRYLEALHAYFRQRSPPRNIDDDRLDEIEKKCVRRFLDGLDFKLARFIRAPPDNLMLSQAIGLAEDAAESMKQSKFAMESRSTASKSEGKTSHSGESGNSSKPFVKNGNFRGRGRGGRGGFSKGSRDQTQTGANGNSQGDKAGPAKVNDGLCHVCKESGHYARECPKKSARASPAQARDHESEGAVPKNGFGASSQERSVPATMLTLRRHH